MITTSKLESVGINPDSKVLFFMPHPDDEAVFCAGILTKLNQAQIKTKVITLTKGEKSTLRYGLNPNQDLGKFREREQKKAFAILGVTNYLIKSLPDGELENRQKEILQLIKVELKTFQPTHIITLEPDGIYGHPDHIALSHFLTQIVKPPFKLLYATVSPHFILPKATHMAKIKNIRPIKAEFRLLIGWVGLITKLKVLQAHYSQFGFLGFNFKNLIFFMKNHMFTSEFFTYRH